MRIAYSNGDKPIPKGKETIFIVLPANSNTDLSE